MYGQGADRKFFCWFVEFKTVVWASVVRLGLLDGKDLLMIYVMRDLMRMVRRAETYRDFEVRALHYGFGLGISYEECTTSLVRWMSEVLVSNDQ